MDTNQIYRSNAENSHKMIYLSDLPKNISYLEISDYYESRIGPCQISIKR